MTSSSNLDNSQGSGPPAKKVSALWVLIGFAVFVPIYAYGRLSSNELVMPVGIVLLSILEAVRLIRGLRESRRLEVACEAAYFAVLLSVFLGVYRTSFAEHRTFMFATILYRPSLTLYCNRRVALIFGLTIFAVVLPITCGMVNRPDAVDLLTVSYALMVAGLWIFCSKFAAWVYGRLAHL